MKNVRHYRLAELSPEFQDFMRAYHAERGWACPEWVHVDLEQMQREVHSKPQAFQDYFKKHGVPPERPKVQSI